MRSGKTPLRLSKVFVIFGIEPNMMKKSTFKFLAKLNKILLPSFTKKRLDLAKATKLQLLIIGWRTYVTLNSLD